MADEQASSQNPISKAIKYTDPSIPILNDTSISIDVKPTLCNSFTTVSLLICILFLEFSIGWGWVIQASVKNQTMIYYGDISSYQFRALNEIFLYIYVPTGLLGCYLCYKNLRLSLTLASIFLIIGSVLQYISANNYYLHLSANFVMGLSQGFIFPAPAVIAQRYFSVKREAVILT